VGPCEKTRCNESESFISQNYDLLSIDMVCSSDLQY
jgi:hypothetical protein